MANAEQDGLKRMEASRVATLCAMPLSDGRHGNGNAFRTKQASRRYSFIISANTQIIRQMTRISAEAHITGRMSISCSSTLPTSSILKWIFLSLWQWASIGQFPTDISHGAEPTRAKHGQKAINNWETSVFYIHAWSAPS